MDVSVVSDKEFENDSSTSENEEFPDETDFKKITVKEFCDNIIQLNEVIFNGVILLKPMLTFTAQQVDIKTINQCIVYYPFQNLAKC
ncbi:hypothetical protein QYM36_015627 [Artemia franciscana]|uniref:Uncharacterized protein n=1 Tax=Artemia franciscana TaxID=6661 RepID=A0AA88HLP8_ARTSF|nr:hypothetical protein QYM36_015627 [Artemia franciscana]